MDRRRFLASGGGVGATLFAGCAAGEHLGRAADDDEPGSQSDDPGHAPMGTFRLLISDRPNAIDDFSELNVTFDTARVYREESDDEESTDDSLDDEGDGADDEVDGDDGDDGAVSNDEPDDGDTDDADDGDDGNEDETDDVDDGDDDGADDVDDGDDGDADDVDDDDETDDADDVNGDDTELEDPDDADEPDPDAKGWVEIDLDGATVDLTTVLGERALPIAEVDLEEGRYSTIHLEVADIEGIAAEPEEDESDTGTSDSDDGSDDDTTDDDESSDAGSDDEDDGSDAENGTDDDRERFPVHVPSGRLRLVRPFEVVEGEEVSFVFDINVVRRGQQRKYNLLPVIGGSGVVGRDVEAEEVSGTGPGGPPADENPGNRSRDGGPPDDRGQSDVASGGQGLPADD